jgi:hypothetical protein
MAEKTSVEELIKNLEDDGERLESSYPDGARVAIKDDKVQKAISNRFDNEQALTEIVSLGYNFYTGLNHTLFQFHSQGDIDIENRGLLVITDGDFNVVGMVDDFNFDRPNSWSCCKAV